MAAENPPYVIQASSHSAALFREVLAGIFGYSQPGTLALGDGGTTLLTDFTISQKGTPNMSVNVSGGTCWIPQTNAANGGLYFGLNDANVNLAISAADSVNPRIDTIVAEVADAAYSGSSNAWSLSVVTGTPTASASLSNLIGLGSQPASSIILGYVLVPANATSIVTADISNSQTLARPGTSGLLQRGTPFGLMVPSGQTVISSGSAALVGMGASQTFGGMQYDATYSFLEVPFSGVYRVSYQIGWTNGGSSVGGAGDYQAQVYVNGVESITSTVYATTGIPTPGGSIDLYLSGGNYLELYGYQTSGANEGTTYAGFGITGTSTYLSVCLVSG